MDAIDNLDKNTKPTDNKLLKIIFFGTVAGGSILFGFSRTYKRPSSSGLYEDGSALARKALLRATVYSVTGFSIFAFACYKLFGQKLIAQVKTNE